MCKIWYMRIFYICRPDDLKEEGVLLSLLLNCASEYAIRNFQVNHGN
jgi:hypothetical protein